MNTQLNDDVVCFQCGRRYGDTRHLVANPELEDVLSCGQCGAAYIWMTEKQRRKLFRALGLSKLLTGQGHGE